MHINGKALTLNGNTIGDAGQAVNTPRVDKEQENNDVIEYEEIKIKRISHHFREIMRILELDLEDDSLKGTPDRVARMYVKELFSGLNAANKPEIALFENRYQYNEMVVEKNITLYSCCEHHFVPIIGKAHVAYLSNGRIIGLSKLNRIVQYHARRPQVQERLTEEIALSLKESLGTHDVAVYIEATHLCVAARGVSDCNSSTVTAHYSGKFKNEEKKKEFISAIRFQP